MGKGLEKPFKKGDKVRTVEGRLEIEAVVEECKYIDSLNDKWWLVLKGSDAYYNAKNFVIAE